MESVYREPQGSRGILVPAACQVIVAPKGCRVTLAGQVFLAHLASQEHTRASAVLVGRLDIRHHQVKVATQELAV